MADTNISLTIKSIQQCVDEKFSGLGRVAMLQAAAADKAAKMKPEVVNVKASELAANGTVSVRVAMLRAA